MTDTPEYQALLQHNRDVLTHHAKRHDLTKVCEIEIESRYSDQDTAMAARTYVVEKYGKPQSILFRVSSHKYSETEITINLAFGLDIVPDADLITKYEFMLQDAADKFGGETPGWEIKLK